MAYEFFDSFDRYGSGSSTDLLFNWDAQHGFSSFTAGRTGNCLDLLADGTFQAYAQKALTAQATKYFAFAFNTSAISNNPFIFQGFDGSTSHVYIRVTSTTIDLWRGLPGGGTQVAQVTGLTFADNTWYHVEFLVTIDDSVGAWTVKIDGDLKGTFTGLDTRNGGNAQLSGFRLGANDNISNGTHLRFDDVIVQNASGGFIGPLQVMYLVPSGAGNSAQMIRGGADSGANWSQVEETPGNSDTDYVEDGTSGELDTYAMSNLTPVSGSVKAIGVVSMSKLDTAGSAQLKHVVRPGSTNQAGAAIGLTTSYKQYQTIWETNPDTGLPWTLASVNASEVGIEVA